MQLGQWECTNFDYACCVAGLWKHEQLMHQEPVWARTIYLKLFNRLDIYGTCMVFAKKREKSFLQFIHDCGPFLLLPVWALPPVSNPTPPLTTLQKQPIRGRTAERLSASWIVYRTSGLLNLLQRGINVDWFCDADISIFLRLKHRSLWKIGRFTFKVVEDNVVILKCWLEHFPMVLTQNCAFDVRVCKDL